MILSSQIKHYMYANVLCLCTGTLATIDLKFYDIPLKSQKKDEMERYLGITIDAKQL